jgi:hypothetical protein
MRDAKRNCQRERGMIRIMASVSGEVSGSRQASLKSNDEIQEFESLTEAQQVASDLNETMKGPAGVTISVAYELHRQLIRIAYQSSGEPESRGIMLRNRASLMMKSSCRCRRYTRAASSDSAATQCISAT